MRGGRLLWATGAILASLLPALAASAFSGPGGGFALAVFPPWVALPDQVAALAGADALLVDGRPGRWVVKVGDGGLPRPITAGRPRNAGLLLPLGGFRGCGTGRGSAA
ncbi:MAG: hypothetical protein PW843_10355 [Azospirillaceae bacterium]|nr:hypothetical protein [Azospirillaceae bacterium]